MKSELGQYAHIDKIICGDCLEEMRKMPDGSVDLIVTSPPYNLGNSSGGWCNGTEKASRWKNAKLRSGYDNHSDNMPHEEYVFWQRECISEMLRLLPDNGAVFYNHKWRVQGGLLQDRADIMDGFPVRQIIIWARPGGINFNDNYFVPTYEVIYLIAKPSFKLIPKANGIGDVWVLNSARNDHPAPFPLELPLRCIKSTAAKLILDPFMGSGTTAVAAKLLGRNYIGIEKSSRYVDMAIERLAEPPLFQAKGTRK